MYIIPNNTRVRFNICQGLDCGTATIKDVRVDKEDGHLCYRLDDIVGSNCDIHRNNKNELWVNDFEIENI